MPILEDVVFSKQDPRSLVPESELGKASHGNSIASQEEFLMTNQDKKWLLELTDISSLKQLPHVTREATCFVTFASKQKFPCSPSTSMVWQSCP